MIFNCRGRGTGGGRWAERGKLRTAVYLFALSEGERLLCRNRGQKAALQMRVSWGGPVTYRCRAVCVWEHTDLDSREMSPGLISIHTRPDPWAQRCLLPPLSLHTAIPSPENFRSLIAKQQDHSVSPIVSLHLQVRITCRNRDVIRSFCRFRRLLSACDMME